MNQALPANSLQIEADLAVFRPQPVALLREAVVLVEQAILAACGRRCTALLVVYDAPGGFAPPSLAERQDMMRRWARAADGRLRMALVLPARYIDPERFGVAAAINYGLTGNVFEQEHEAREWLAAHQG